MKANPRWRLFTALPPDFESVPATAAELSFGRGVSNAVCNAQPNGKLRKPVGLMAGSAPAAAIRCRRRMSWQNVLLCWALRRWVRPGTLRRPDLATMRARSARVPFGAKLPPGWRIRRETAGPLRGEWIEPAAPSHAAHRRRILYLHGGGYFSMSARTHRAITSRLAAWSDASLFALDYRLAPEHRFPAALEDAVAAFRWLVAAGTPPARIVVAGDSAGGGLALATLAALRDAQQPRAGGAVLFSPWTDLAGSGPSITGNEGRDPMFSATWVATIAGYYLGSTPASHPLASPLYADLAGLPPMLVQASESEILLDDSRRLVERARQAGVAATLQLWPDPPHGWQMYASFLPEARSALRDAARFIRERLS